MWKLYRFLCRLLWWRLTALAVALGSLFQRCPEIFQLSHTIWIYKFIILWFYKVICLCNYVRMFLYPYVHIFLCIYNCISLCTYKIMTTCLYDLIILWVYAHIILWPYNVIWLQMYLHRLCSPNFTDFPFRKPLKFVILSSPS